MTMLASPEFERYVAKKVSSKQYVIFDEMIFAKIDGLTADNLANYLTMPQAAQIVHRETISKAGFIDDNKVVYSAMLGSNVGDFEFNYIGLINRSENVLAVACFTDTIRKRRSEGRGYGNSLTRNIILHFTGAREATGINISAQSWQVDFTKELLEINAKVLRLSSTDGFKHVGQCESIAQLRTIEPTENNQHILVKGYHAGSHKGGGRFVSDFADNQTVDNGGTVIVTAGGKRWKRICDSLTIFDFGVNLSSDNQTTIIQQALTAAAQDSKLLELEKHNYIVDSLTIPAGSRLKTNGAIFENNAITSGRALTVYGNVEVDTLNLHISGAANVSGIKICGSDVKIGKLSCVANNESQYGVFIQSLDGSQLSDIKIDAVEIKKFSSAMPVFNATGAIIANISIEQYVTGVYLRDVSHSYFERAKIKGTSPKSSGGAGNNGLLIESTLATGSTNNLHFIGWDVRDSGEHAYRLGGQLSINDIWFTNCRAGKTGNAVNNQATGGCGFKVLGATSVKGQWHRNIYFDNCHVEDVNTNARGQGNFAGFLISNVGNIHITNCSVVPNDYNYSCWHAYSFESVEDVFLSNNISSRARQHAIRFVASTYAAHPGWEGIIRNVVIHGGSYSVFQNADSAAIYFTKGSGEAGRVSEINMSGTRIRGGVAAIRIESYYTPTDCYFDFSYSDPKSTDSAPPLLGAPVLCNIRSKWFGSYGAPAKGGSTFIDTDTGIVRERISGVWQVKTLVNAKSIVLNATPAKNVASTRMLRAKYSQTGNIVTVSGQIEIEASKIGDIAVDLSLPIPAAIESWADCAGTFNTVDNSIHGVVAFDKAMKTIRLTGRASLTENRNCAFIASYLI